jgi:toxin ParE1/3/4
MKIIWTESAQASLQEIGDYIAQDSPDRALSFLSDLIDQTEKVLRFPRAGRVASQRWRQNIYER